MNNMPRNFPHTIKLDNDREARAERAERVRHLQELWHSSYHLPDTDTCLSVSEQNELMAQDSQSPPFDVFTHVERTQEGDARLMQSVLHGDPSLYKPEAENVSPHCLTMMAESGTFRDAPKRHVDSEQGDEDGRVGNLLGNAALFIFGGAVCACLFFVLRVFLP